MAAVQQDALPAASGEDGLAVLKVVSQLAASKQKSMANRQYVKAEEESSYAKQLV